MVNRDLFSYPNFVNLVRNRVPKFKTYNDNINDTVDVIK